VTRDNWRAMLALSVHPAQQRFVAGYVPIAAIVLAKAYVRPEALVWRPYAFYEHDVPVGMVALAFEDHSEDRYWIYHFFIDVAHQGRGLGKRAMEALIALIQREHPRCRRVSLTVHPDNHVAQALYQRLGFAPTGDRKDDEPVFVRNLT
jgi:diamine N-acetyltransferase